MAVGQGGRTQGGLLEDHPLVAVAVRAKPHLALVALKGEVGEVHVTSQLRDNVEVLADCNWAGVYKMLEPNCLQSLCQVDLSEGVPYRPTGCMVMSRFNEAKQKIELNLKG